ncbi:pilin [Salisediminibacterium selenitireducens]|uniref:Prepilin-type N-terminal cleavage/methylation domain-containing protein n=1 Tax=Bacillus selenitireducens (strain ATCC 700615 / DSM 15326 / MLS10) TaxID=439292 RepID=D6XW06_BACIE|nr:hypothetical protein Bsel_0234 [[Bacillus] selenitireducens MLS10]
MMGLSRNDQRGLTLIELLAVIVIVGILAAIAVPAVNNVIENSRKDAHLATAEAIYEASRLAVIDRQINAGDTDTTAYVFYTGTSSKLNEFLGGGENGIRRVNLVEDGYLDSHPINPHTREPYQYTVLLRAGNQSYIQLTYGDGNTEKVFRLPEPSSALDVFIHVPSETVRYRTATFRHHRAVSIDKLRREGRDNVKSGSEMR